MSPGGRRPGKGNTREDIVRAAKDTFATQGYEGASLRAVARAAGVDAALVHHYFDGKADLFIAAMALPFDPREVHLAAESDTDSSGFSGAATVEGFLTMWDLAEDTGSSFVSCAGAMAASTDRGRCLPPVRQGEGLGTDPTDPRRERGNHGHPSGPGGVAAARTGVRQVRPARPATLHRPARRHRSLGRSHTGQVQLWCIGRPRSVRRVGPTLAELAGRS